MDNDGGVGRRNGRFFMIVLVVLVGRDFDQSGCGGADDGDDGCDGCVTMFASIRASSVSVVRMSG